MTLRKSGGDWVEVRFAAEEDGAFVAELAALAAAAHRPTRGAGKPLPSGPDLERRRRFH